MSRPHFLFVTGKLAEPALRRIVTGIATEAGFDFTLAVLPITVAALATTSWIASHLTPPGRFERILLPGLCRGELDVLHQAWGAAVERGPKDLRDLPEFFGKSARTRQNYGAFDISILAEINHAPRLPFNELLQKAQKARADGADLIDLGCDPGHSWTQAGDAVRMLRAEGMRVSLDSFEPRETELAANAGAELILSVNHSNRDFAKHWGCEVVAIPDQPAELQGLDATLEVLERDGVRYRIDPILEPIGFGFAASLGRYLQVRRLYPSVEILMGVGNLTELTDVDSAGVNTLLLGFCQEVGIRSVLTTEVINWCRSSVKELDLARRLMFHAVCEGMLPKNLEPDLIQLRDPRLREFGEDSLRELADNITDRNFRLFAEGGLLHVINRAMHLRGADPFVLFEEMQKHGEIDASHAFYLGYELAKAVTALTLGKNYTQDQALRWGHLTRPEMSHQGE